VGGEGLRKKEEGEEREKTKERETGKEGGRKEKLSSPHQIETLQSLNL
jgi:hypothetical protein